MIRSTPAIFGLLAVFCQPQLVAQQPHEPQVSVVHAGFRQLKDDLKLMFDLTPGDEQEQWENLELFLDGIEIGIDTSRPIRVDVLTGLDPVAYMIRVPYSDLVDLRDNLASFDLETRREQTDAGLFRFLGDSEQGGYGWLRDQREFQHAPFMVLDTEKNLSLARQLITRLGNPDEGLDGLSTESASIAAVLRNAAVGTDDQQKRRDSFAGIRENSLDVLQQRPDETDTEFALRRTALSNQLDELERILAEMHQINAEVVLDRDALHALLNWTASAIPETGLAESVGLFAGMQDDFASIPRAEGAVFSGRIAHPIDELRQQNVLSYIDLLRADFVARIGRSETLDDGQQTAAVEVFDGMMAVIRDGISSGRLNGFTEVLESESGDLSTVSGMAAVDAGRLNDVLPKISQIGDKNEFEADIAEVDGVRIHRVKVGEGYFTIAEDFFGAQRDVFVGVGDKAVWLASGEGGLERLKATIADCGDPADAAAAIDVRGHLLPWIRRTLTVVEKRPEPNTVDGKQERRDQLRRLSKAVESMASEDGFAFSMNVDGESLSGTGKVEAGALRFVGRMLSAFTKENLAE